LVRRGLAALAGAVAVTRAPAISPGVVAVLSAS